MPSPPYLTPQSSNIHPTSSGFSFSVVFVCTSHSPHVFVGAVALLTPLATTAQHVPSQESCEREEAPLKGQQHGFAGKGELESPPILGSRISTSTPCPESTIVASRLSPMGYHVGGKPVSSRYHLGIAPHQVR